MRDHHRRQRFEQLGDDVAAAVGAQPLDALDDELAHLGLHRLDLPRGETARHQLAKLGVHRRVLHDERRIILQPNQFQIVIVDRQSLRRREGLVVARRRPDVGVPGQHVVVVLWVLRQEQRGAPGRCRATRGTSARVWARCRPWRARSAPGVVRHNCCHVSFVRQIANDVNRAHGAVVAGEAAESSSAE